MAKIIHILGLEHQIGDESVRKDHLDPGGPESTHGHMTLRPWRGSGQRALRRRALIVAPRCSQVALALRQPLEAARAGCSTACSCATVPAAARVASMAAWLAAVAATVQRVGAPRGSRRHPGQLTVSVHAAHFGARVRHGQQEAAWRGGASSPALLQHARAQWCADRRRALRAAAAAAALGSRRISGSRPAAAAVAKIVANAIVGRMLHRRLALMRDRVCA